MPNGSLSLPARLHLLAWDAARPEGAGPLVRSGALTELAQRGLLVDEDGIATPVDLDSRTGDPVLDGLLELVRESLPHRWRTWVTLRARTTLAAVREQLVAEGYLGAERKRVLGVFPSVEYVLERGAAVDALRKEARSLLDGAVPVGEVAERDAALAALAVAGGLLEPAGDRERVARLTERSGPGLHNVVREVCAAVTAATAVTASTGG
ncbi:GPP34 family phosphoprotein [Streptomyces sp. S.PNR 29]|uniref:GOLPH3/VPS74 family protein n=1 Tax=Streptomyces sp. S.PNR 29 TaxID=2973805 RepID=UPI0025B27876|nr:GPP34 family phosphoprotein [Streptomyces sp. S.PNR 29]MDN0198628.1 GPP34 family phosphoprotein [Streptomyces sp. S.PNR 29]